MIKKISLFSLASLLFLAWMKFQGPELESPFQAYQQKTDSENISFNTTQITQKEIQQVKKAGEDKREAPTSPQEKRPQAGGQAPMPNFAADEHAYTEEGELLLSQVLVIEENAIAHGDILIGSYDEMLEYEKRGELPKMKPPSLWDKGIVPYSIDSDYSYPERVKRVIEYFHKETPIRFVEWDNSSEDYVLFTSGPEHCFAHLGKRGGEQKVVLSSGCQEREIAHEIMHVLGFLHEQNREDRDQHLVVHWDNIEEVYHEQFKKMPNPFTQGLTLPFDLSSIMIYSPFSFAVDTNRPTMTKKSGELYEQTAELLSEGDKKKIKLLYR